MFGYNQAYPGIIQAYSEPGVMMAYSSLSISNYFTSTKHADVKVV